MTVRLQTEPFYYLQEYKARSDHPLVLQMFSPLEIIFYEFSTDPAAKSFFYTFNIGQQIFHE